MTFAKETLDKDRLRSMADIAPPIFILCPGRSFSSVVCAMLGQHPQLFGLPEMNLFLAETVRDLLDLSTPPFGPLYMRHGLLRSLAFLTAKEQTEDAIKEANRWLKAHQQWTGTQVFQYITTLAAPARCIDKTPTNARVVGLRRIISAFPDAHFLHLARHPRASCRSRHKVMTKRRSAVIEELDHERYWASRHALILKFADQLEPQQYMYIKGEDLLNDPDTHLVRIAEWLGVSTDPDAIEAMKHPEHSPFAQVGPNNAKGGNNAGFIQDPVLRTGKMPAESLAGPLEWRPDGKGFEPHTIALARQLGYD